MSFSGRFVWRELITPTPSRAAEFYTSLFGWTSKAVEMGMPEPYVLLHHPGLAEDVGGMMKPAMPEAPAMWLDYVTVDDVDAALARIPALGGQVVMEARTIPGVGRFGVAADPTGALFAPFKGDNPGMTDTERRPPIGTFCWSALMTTSLDRAVPFYTSVFGWDAAPMGPDMAVFASGAAQRASAQTLPPEAPQRSYWLTYVAVEDVDTTAARAVELGAAVLVPGTDMPGMGRFAILRDPTGAAFALWKDNGAMS